MIEVMFMIFSGIIVIGIPSMIGMFALYGIFQLMLILFEMVCNIKDEIEDKYYDWKVKRENIKKQK